MPEGQGVQQEFAFIPDDGSATYVVNVERNSTKVLTGQYLLLLLYPFAPYSTPHYASLFDSQNLLMLVPYRPPTKRPLCILHHLTHRTGHARFQRPGGISRV